MKRIVKDRKFLMGLALSLVLAMAVGSFALGEIQTPATPQVQTQSLAAANDEDTGAFKVEGGSYGTDADYHFGGTSGTDGVLYIHPQDAKTEITVSNEGTTTDRIEVTKAATIILAGVNIDMSNALGVAGLTIPSNAAFDVNILLEDNTQNILKGSKEYKTSSDTYASSPGIFKGDGDGTLTIGVKEGANGTGQLEAVAGDGTDSGAAGIGSAADSCDAKNITITGGIITARGSGGGAGIGGVRTLNAENIKITGGKVYAYGGRIEGKSGGSGIGVQGDATCYVRNITISGGEVEAYGYRAPGIGGQSVDGINISGGKVTAIAEDIYTSAGIGSNGSGEAENINITGGVIIATGGDSGPGIGSALTKSISSQNITLNGDAVVLATAGSNSTVDPIAPTTYFTFNKGIAFTRKGTGDYAGEMRGDVTVTESVEISTDFTVTNSKLTIASENSLGNEINFSIANGKILTIDNGSELINEGRISIPESSLNCSNGGQITTLLKYDPQGGSFDDLTDSYQLYKDSSGAGKSYTNLPTEVTNAEFKGWNRNADGTGAKLSESTVDLNLHQAYADMDYTVTFDSQGGSAVAGTTSKYNVKLTKPASDPTKKGYDFDGWYKEEGCTTLWDFEKDTVQGDMTLYAKWTPKAKHQIVTNQPENGSIELDKDEATEGDEVSFTLTPDEGYELKEGSVKVTDEDGNEIALTEKDGKYIFEMPDSEVTISAVFEQIPTPTPPTPTPPQPGPEPTPTPEPTPDPSVDPDSGSGASSKTGDPFMGGAALALLGVATTGAVILRKRK